MDLEWILYIKILIILALKIADGLLDGKDSKEINFGQGNIKICLELLASKMDLNILKSINCFILIILIILIHLKFKKKEPHL